MEPARLDQALEGIASATSRLALLGPGEADLNRARTLLLARWARRNESMEGRASALASAEALGRIELLDEGTSGLAPSPLMTYGTWRDATCCRRA